MPWRIVRCLVLGLPLVFVTGLLFVPLGLTIVISFWERAGLRIRPALSFAAYEDFFSGVRLEVLRRSLMLAGEVTVIALLIAYPIAYFLAPRAGRGPSRMALLLFTIPFLVNYVIRTFAWSYLLSRTGPINRSLIALGLTSHPLDWLLYSDFAVFIGMLASYMPFMIFPLWLSLSGIDRHLVHASWLLGAGPVRTFLRITLPLSLPGV